MDYKLDDIISQEVFPGFHGKMIHTQNMTMAFWEVEAGAEVPVHSHSNEQIMQVLNGHFEFTLNGSKVRYRAGDLVVIPPNAEHSGKAISACKLMDIFSPAREDYKL